MERKIAPKNVDDYLKSFTGKQKETLDKLRTVIKAAAPEAEEVISYGIPAYKQNGILVYFGGFKDHCSFFPASYATIEQFQEELKNYKIAKGTIRFPINKPIASSLIKKMVQAKIKENERKQQAKASKKHQSKKKPQNQFTLN